MMKYVFILLLLTFAQYSFGQDRIEGLRIAFISQRLELTPAESQQFWPVYNEFKSKLDEIEKPRHRRIKDNLSEKEAEDMLEKGLLAEEQKVNLKREYYAKLKKVISAKKVLELQRAERDFKHELIGHIREERGKSSEKASRNKD
jgi:hypothetical protein